MTQDELKKGNYVEIEGEAASQDELQEAIKRTRNLLRMMIKIASLANKMRVLSLIE